MPRSAAGPWREGVFLNDEDQKSYAAVAVLGQTVVKSLLPDGGDPIGRYVLINNVPFQVIGVMSTKGRERQRRRHG